jgi:hypothetical protein
MSTLTFIAEGTKTTVLTGPTDTAVAKEAYMDVTPGSMSVNCRAVATMADAADMIITLKTADDATGTGAADFATPVPLYVDGVRLDNAITYTVADDTGNFVIDFCVDPGLIPENKYIGLHVAASNVANTVCTTAIENPTDRPSK